MALMTKAEVAERLKTSERNVTRFAAKGELRTVYVENPNGGSPFARYESDEVDAFIEKRAQPKAKPERIVETRPRVSELQAGLIERLSQTVLLLGAGKGESQGVPLSDKLTLSLAEAVKLSGLSEVFLRRAIQAGELRAVRGRSRGWSIKASDLRGFVEGL